VDAVPVAAPAPAAPVLLGAARAVRVIAVTSSAAYLATGDRRLPALCLSAPDAMRLPCSLVLPDRSLGGLRAGQPGTVGGGAVRVDDRAWRVARWWRPARPSPAERPPTPAATAALARWVPDPLDPAGRACVERLVAAVRAGADPAPAVDGLIGWGPGLTPLGDDVLAAALITVRAYAGDRSEALSAAVAGAVGRTTVVSAALLAHAARGECVAALAGLLDAVGRGAAPPDLARAAAAVAAIGHTSGPGLVHGVIAGLSAVGPA
jgi:hypothetical protein